VQKKQSSTQDETASAGLPRPRRRFGQNFLASPAAVARIVAALDPVERETVLEIGPGQGALTESLLARVPRLIAIEVDRDLAAILRERHPASRLRVITADVLEVSFASLSASPLTIAGNLPYNISKPVAMKLVDERDAVSRAVLMFQKEVADRLVARPGTAAYGPLTVLVGRAFAVARLFDLPPGAFHPRPKVTSTVTSWQRRPERDLPPELVPPLKEALRASFGRRRQTMMRNLRDHLAGGEAAARSVLSAAGIEGGLRAEALPPEAFLALARAWPTTLP